MCKGLSSRVIESHSTHPHTHCAKPETRATTSFHLRWVWYFLRNPTESMSWCLKHHHCPERERWGHFLLCLESTLTILMVSVSRERKTEFNDFNKVGWLPTCVNAVSFSPYPSIKLSILLEQMLQDLNRLIGKGKVHENLSCDRKFLFCLRLEFWNTTFAQIFAMIYSLE